MATTPMTIHLYDAEDNQREFNRAFVPWKLLKMALRLGKQFYGKGINELTEEDLDALAGLIVEAFGNQFSISDLDEQGDVTEMMAVFQNITARAQGANPNGIPPVG